MIIVKSTFYRGLSARQTLNKTFGDLIALKTPKFARFLLFQQKFNQRRTFFPIFGNRAFPASLRARGRWRQIVCLHFLKKTPPSLSPSLTISHGVTSARTRPRLLKRIANILPPITTSLFFCFPLLLFIDCQRHSFPHPSLLSLPSPLPLLPLPVLFVVSSEGSPPLLLAVISQV